MKPPSWLSQLWHLPSALWRGMIAAAPATTWLTAGAAMASTIGVGLLVWLFREKLGTDQAFWIIESALLVVLVTICALAGIEVGLSAGRGGVTASVGKDADPPVARVVTETTVTAGASPADDDDPTRFGGPRG